ncbi:hypothetical protein [Pseudoruegeria sp. HB172150]|uniref:hypothetical protein n=1 Tax=Pseudoruegeria sp. HB172150 TaxID=2721164 RepID=UPI0015541160|nr:hypothetical protein [Pseudoruegeria sp. HB172150]
MFQTLTLRPLRLPEGALVRRERPAPEAARGADYDAKFDFHTLVYGAVWLPDRKTVLLICPRLMNLAAVLKEAVVASAAGRLRFGRVTRYRRWQAVTCYVDDDPGPELTVTLPDYAGGAQLSFPVMPRVDAFTNLRCLLTKSKDNQLDWIGDWAQHHVRMQGTEAIVLFDNGSTRYAPDDVTDRLASVPGLKAALVISADLPFGPTATKSPRNVARYFQSATLNLAKHWVLRRAAAVAVNDIDELFVSQDDRTIYDAAAESWFGYATAQGNWRAAPHGEGPTSHGDHVLAWQPERTCKEKWAVIPGGRLGRISWDVHGIGRYQFNRLAMVRDVRFLHCEHISTDWKRPRAEAGDRLGAQWDAATAELLTRSGLRQADA